MGLPGAPTALSLTAAALTATLYCVQTLNLGEAAASMFTRAAFDGSTHYAAEGHYMAERLKATFPWVRVSG